MWQAAIPFTGSWKSSKGTDGIFRPETGLFAVLGPGLLVCLANSDIGAIFTMAVAGARAGYLLLLLQLLLIPALFMAQELTVRLGAFSHRSLSGLAFDHLGRAFGTLTLIACVSVSMMAVVSEFTGVAAVGELWGIPRLPSCLLSAMLLSAVVLKANLALVEKVGLAVATFFCVFIILGFCCRPGLPELQATFSHNPMEVIKQPHIRSIVAANIGTVIAPWMLFYQLSAMVEKRLVPANIALARLDTAVGVVATQALMASVLMIFARLARGSDLEHMPLHEALVSPLQPLIGEFAAKVLMTCGLLGSSILATLVASLAVEWNCGDTIATMGRSTVVWRLVVLGSVALGALIVGCNLVNIIHMNVTIQVVNGLTMPFVVSMLFLLARSDALPPAMRLQGPYAVICGATLSACAAITLTCALF